MGAKSGCLPPLGLFVHKAVEYSGQFCFRELNKLTHRVTTEPPPSNFQDSQICFRA